MDSGEPSLLAPRVSLDYKQRLQQLFFPEGIAYDGNRFDRTAITAPLFNYLTPSESADETMVTLPFASWNLILGFLQQIEAYSGLPWKPSIS